MITKSSTSKPKIPHYGKYNHYVSPKWKPKKLFPCPSIFHPISPSLITPPFNPHFSTIQSNFQNQFPRNKQRKKDMSDLSPTASSLSSSDLDTESTGSFFHDTSTSLGTLMGVTFQAITTFRASSQPAHPVNNCLRKNKRRRWWMLCREEARRSSLGDFLEVERRFGGEIEEGVVREFPRNGRVLFQDGRVLPPVEGSSPETSGICRFSAVVYLTGICNCRSRDMV